MSIFSRLNAVARLGAGELRSAYQEHKRQIEFKAKQKRARAKTAIERARIRAEEAKEMADLKSAMYQAQINAQNAQKRAKQLRHQAGHYTVGERATRFAQDTYKVGRSFAQGFASGSKSTRKRSS